ncbi:hypothetical protein EDB89DRAFT_2072060 [Lactarius sanguifluus]|nr:hypothetical protein EDB89DRAFT_2072060 [Lactarius sanguifluus]
MSTARSGSCTVSCRAFLEHPRIVQGKPRTIIFDVLIFGTNAVNNSCLIPCSLRFFKADDDIDASPGVYDIVATIVAYRTNVNEASPSVSEDDFKLMGDIYELKTIPSDTEGAIAACRIPARVFGTGMVTSLEKQDNSFVLSLSQYVGGGSQNDLIVVRALMEKGPKWPEPAKRLPALSGLVYFTGRLSHIEDNPDSKHGSAKERVVVTLDNITYLPRTSAKPASSVSSSAVNLTEDGDTIALKNRLRKYSKNEEPTRTTTPSAGPSTIGKKWKAADVDVGGGKADNDDVANEEQLIPASADGTVTPMNASDASAYRFHSSPNDALCSAQPRKTKLLHLCFNGLRTDR